MVYKINDSIYSKVGKYTFKEQIFLNNNKILVFCFVVAKKGGVVECLLQSICSGFSKCEKDKVIKDYLDNKIKALECDYSTLSSNTKELIEVTKYKVGNN